MKAAIFALAAALALAGCATHSDQQLATARAAGVSRDTMEKLEHRGVLAPEDVIELRRRGVSDTVVLRQLDKVGVDYVAQRDDLARLRKAGVSPDVRAALARASERFIDDRHRPFVGPDIYYYDDFGYPYGYPYFPPYRFAGVGYGGFYDGRQGGWGGGHRHR
jgi:hypothetical protein